MTKKRTNISLDPQVYQDAKQMGLNVSQITERALRKWIHKLEGKENTYPRATGEGRKRDFGDQTTEEFLEDFQQACRTDWNLAESTTKERVRYAKKLVEHLGAHPLEADRKNLREFLKNFHDDNAVNTVRVIYGRYFGSDLAECFKVPNRPLKPKRVPDKSELREVYKRLEDPRMEAAFLILASSGLRRGELMKLTPSQFDFEDRAIYPPEGEQSATKRQWVTFYN